MKRTPVNNRSPRVGPASGGESHQGASAPCCPKVYVGGNCRFDRDSGSEDGGRSRSRSESGSEGREGRRQQERKDWPPLPPRANQRERRKERKSGREDRKEMEDERRPKEATQKEGSGLVISLRPSWTNKREIKEEKKNVESCRSSEKEEERDRSVASVSTISDRSLRVLVERMRVRNSSFGRLSDGEAGRKRRRGSDEDTPESSDIEEVVRAPRKVSSVSRGRGPGRPPTHGRYVGLAKAKQELEEAQRAAEEADRAAEKAAKDRETEKKVAEWTRNNARSSRLFSVSGSDMDPTDHGSDIEEDVAVIKMIATKSGNLKGNYVRALKNAAASISDKFQKTARKNTSEEEAKLRAENAQLRASMDTLRKEFDQVRAELSRLTDAVGRTTRDADSAAGPKKSSPPIDDDSLQRIAVMVGTMMDAKMAALEPRLLPAQRERPPLAADSRRRQSEEVMEVPEAQLSPTPPKKKAAQAKKAKEKKRKKEAKGGGNSLTPSLPLADVPPPVQSGGPKAVLPSPSEGWSTVVKRGGRRNPQPQAMSREQGARKKRRIRGPKSSAIVLTLRPEALSRGVRYIEMLVKIKTSISLASVGITGGVRIKEAQTGAKLIEVPGSGSEAQADQLAAKIREVLGEDVWVTRPVKCSELRITDLDESISAEEVANAIVAESGRPRESLRIGEIRREARGRRGFTLWVRCPTTAAKALAQKRTILVGWVPARVTLLEPRPLTCFRCMELGHVCGKCDSDIDRSALCYRCGKGGHKAATCTADPHCSLCAAANLPATHRVGGRACVAAAKKRKSCQSDQPKVSSARPMVSQEAMEESAP